MPPYRNREEVINTQLAILISKLGVTADAETIHIHGKHRPDVLFELRGLRVVIEGKFEDVSNNEKIVLEDARRRVQSGIAHIAAATIYPVNLRSTPTIKIEEQLKTSQLKYRIVAETHESEDWFEGTPTSLMEALRRAQEALTKDDIVEQTAKSLNSHLEAITQLWIGQRGACDRLSTILGINPPIGETEKKAHARRETAAKVSALVLANAYIFQEQLAATDGRVSPLRKLEVEHNTIEATANHWRWIWENINYVPIFQLGERVLNELPNTPNSLLPVKRLLLEAKSICSQQAALRHDLMGRIYHWLLHDGKFLGTYYTSVSAATLLLKLTMASDWKIDFGDPAELVSFKVADLACGTGTLLMATAQSISDIYIKKRAESDRPLNTRDLSTLHKTLMQNVLYGYDVLPSAVHLTASTLAMLAPEVAFVNMNLYVMPLGMDINQAKLGSLDFLSSDVIQTQMALDYSQAETVRMGVASNIVTNAILPKMNLCVMNPPFVRSVGGNLLFGSLPDERGKLQDELKKRVKKVNASITAGLGSVFIALADKHLKVGGRLAFVLPAALASGEAWATSRKLIAERYHLETVVSSYDAERPNFSENTSLSEILFIARKLGSNEKPDDTTYINLWRNPNSVHEAMDLANRILLQNKPVSIETAGVTTIKGVKGKLGEMVTMPPAKNTENWEGVLFAQTELLRVYWKLKNGKLMVPGANKEVSLPVCNLSGLGELGYDQRDIHDAFEVSYDDWSPYPAFWNHDSNKVEVIAQNSTSNLIVRTKATKGRKLKSAEDVWAKSGKILLAERLRTNTHKVIAIAFEKLVLGNTWWAFRTSILTQEMEKAFLLWINSSLGLLNCYSNRVITEGAWFKMKKPAWLSMPVLDVRQLNQEQLTELASAYDSLCKQKLEPIAQLHNDPVRQKIDDALSKVLSLPSLSAIRELLAREPGLTAKDINPDQTEVLDDEEEDTTTKKRVSRKPKRGNKSLT